MERKQYVLETAAGLSQKQSGELKEWWGKNYPNLSAPRKMVIPLDNRYIDFELRAIEE